MDNLKQNILKKIQDGEITQTSKFYFVTKDYVFYFLTFLSIVLGSIAVSSILFQSITEHLRPLRDFSTSRDLWISFAKTAPYLWLIVLMVLVVVAWINFKHTKRAYKKQNGLIVAFVVIMSFVGGGVLFATGHSERIEQKVRNNLPLYQSEIERRQQARDNFTKLNIQQMRKGDKGLRYVAPPHRCPTFQYKCEADEIKFENRRGCGCTSGT